ncbi:MAG TPA: tol-pal system protein YbgF, partial [Thermomicrobiales bacterium]|nr:tol-pal system protein YbgF [Thermomicrobiales bacterium]
FSDPPSSGPMLQRATKLPALSLIPLGAVGLAASLAAAVPAAAAPRPVLLAQLSDSDVAVRLNRLEDENRRLTGEIEELRHEVQLLSARLPQQGGAPAGAGTSAAPPPGPAPAATTAAPPAMPGPDVADDEGAGGPPPDQGPPSGGPGAPLVIAPNLVPEAVSPPGPGTANPPFGGSAPAVAPPSPQQQGGGTNNTAALPSPPSNTPADTYALAKGYMERHNYEDAALQYKDFLSTFPHDPRTGEALYGLGESYYMRRRYNDALEPFLKVVTDHSSSPRAPDAMLRLGQTLAAINQKSQACATFNALPKKFPRATEDKAKARHELQANGC